MVHAGAYGEAWTASATDPRPARGTAQPRVFNYDDLLALTREYVTDAQLQRSFITTCNKPGIPCP